MISQCLECPLVSGRKLGVQDAVKALAGMPIENSNGISRAFLLIAWGCGAAALSFFFLLWVLFFQEVPPRRFHS